MALSSENRRAWWIDKRIGIVEMSTLLTLLGIGTAAWYGLRGDVQNHTLKIQYLEQTDARIEKTAADQHKEFVELFNARMDRLEKRLDNTRR